MSEITTLEEYAARCEVCDEHRYVIRERKNLAVAEQCAECFESCPACHGEEYQFFKDERGYEFARRCDVCGNLDRRIRVFNEARIPGRYAGKADTLEHYRTLCYKNADNTGPIGNLPLVHSRLYRWAQSFVPGEKGFVLHGDVGTGKTHLLAAILRHLTLEKGAVCRFVEFTHLLSDIKEKFDEGRGEAAVLGPIVGLPVLAIDELGKGRKNDWQLSIIDELISKRYNQNLTTLFTTNYPLEAPSRSGDVTTIEFKRGATVETLRERVGERIYSRLHEMADFIEIDAPDFRRQDEAETG